MNEYYKKMTPKEFREQGYLQEINRRLLHPLGLALEIELLPDGTERFGGVWDCREDPEGLIYSLGIIDQEKADRIYTEQRAKRQSRLKILGFDVQPPNEK